MASPLLPIFLTVFVDVLGMTMIFPLLPFYAQHFGATPLIVGALSASFAVCQLISGPILGRLSDRYGRKPVLIASQLGTCTGFLVLGFANALPMLFIGRMIDGMTAGNLSIAQAYISDVTKPENRTKAFGLIGIAFGVGFLVGPAMSGWLAARFGYAAPAFGAAGLSALSVLTTITILPARPPTGATIARGFAFQRFFTRPEPRKRLLEMFAYGLSFFTLIGGLALYLERQMGYDVEHTGYVFAFSGLVGAFVQGGPIGKLAKRFGEEKLSLFAFIAMAIGYGLLGWVGALWMLLALTALSALGSSLGRPSLTTLLTKSVGIDEQGALLGMSQSMTSMAQIIGPLLAGFLIGKGQLAAYGLAAGGFSLMGALIRYGLKGEARVASTLPA